MYLAYEREEEMGSRALIRLLCGIQKYAMGDVVDVGMNLIRLMMRWGLDHLLPGSGEIGRIGGGRGVVGFITVDITISYVYLHAGCEALFKWFPV